MGDGFQFIDIILLAMIAAFIALRLRSVLGRRTGEERPPATEPMERRGAEGRAHAERPPVSETVVRLEADPKLRRAFRDIRAVDPGFDVDAFLDGAKAIYPMILEAFWRGDRDTLQRFVSDDVFDQFSNAIASREEAGHSVEGRVVDLSNVQVNDAALVGTTAEITVRYEAEIVSVTRDAEGNIVEGNVSDTTSVTDLWTFERDLDSEDPNWTLIATQSA